MASPFRIFRRHQKALLIVAGVILMLVFVLADSLQSIMGQGSGGPNEDGRPNAGAVAVRWDGGKLTNAELDRLVSRRRVLNNFLSAILERGAYAEQLQALSSGIAPRPRPNVDLVAQRTSQQQGVENDVVRVRLFSEAGRKLGMQVSDEMIRMYLDELGFGRVSRSEMEQIAAQIYQNSGVTITYLFDALREELLAQNYEKSYSFAISTVTPAERYSDWLRVNDRVAIEAAPFPAEQFLIDVTEPTDDELTAYYELYKDREPQPDFSLTPELPSPFPGFRISRKLDVQYVKADFNAMLEKVKSELTEEEIQRYYDDNKDPYFIKAEPLAAPATEASAEAPIDETPAEATNVTETEAAEDAKQPQNAETATPETPAEDQKSSTAPAAGDPNDSAANTRPSAGRIEVIPVAFTQADDDNPAATVAQPAPAADADQKATASAPAPSQPAATESTENAATGGGETPATAAAEQKPKEFQPLDEVRDEIRRSLATPKVHERLDELIDKIRAQLNAEFNKYFTAYIDAEAAKKPLPAPPASLTDLSAIAQEHGLEYRKTGELSALELRDDEVIGKLIDLDRSNFQYQTPILATLLSKDTDLYKPLSTVDVDNNRYIVMKTSDTPGRTPLFDDIRDEVVRAWKLEKATELANKRAEEIAAKAETSGESLADYFANDENVKVMKTDYFSWWTSGDVPLTGGQLRLSEPEGIVAAGPAFMREVFELKDGSVGSAQNHDHSIAYVIRLVDHELTQDKRRDAYLSEVNTWPGLQQMQMSHQQYAFSALSQSVYESVNLVRERPLDPVATE